MEKVQVEAQENEEVDHLVDCRVYGRGLYVWLGVFQVWVLENAQWESGHGFAPGLQLEVEIWEVNVDHVEVDQEYNGDHLKGLDEKLESGGVLYW